MTRRRTLVTTLVIVAVTVALDQVTKIWAESALDDGDVIEQIAPAEVLAEGKADDEDVTTQPATTDVEAGIEDQVKDKESDDNPDEGKPYDK